MSVWFFFNFIVIVVILLEVCTFMVFTGEHTLASMLCSAEEPALCSSSGPALSLVHASVSDGAIFLWTSLYVIRFITGRL